GGSEIYLRRLLEGLAALDRENEYAVFTNRESRGGLELGPNFREYPCSVRARFRPQRILWEQFLLPLRARKLKLDLLHSPGFTAPLLCPCPSVVTILDLIYLNFPETFPAPARMMMRFFTRRGAKRSAGVIALSGYSRDEMLWDLDLPPRKVRVIPLGAPEKESDGLSPERRKEVLSRLLIAAPYILTISAAHPHKNIFRLLEAFYQLRRKGMVHQLVVVGVKHGRYFEELRQVLQRLEIEKHVVFTGWIPEAEKESILTGADLLVFPSLLEGFGLPVLEAMRFSVPVACSDVPSLLEVSGDAAHLFNPYSVEEIGRAMEVCLTMPELRRDLIEKGRKQAANFSWEKTARLTLDLYREVAASGLPTSKGRGPRPAHS
ncbi:MAG: glycosyltransferase family 1 protein, partial [Candidatus Aureabacteria bacterium]|nr:glycosyltransferase family 1 protein [Candidatus Auribacterota bacterium]